MTVSRDILNQAKDKIVSIIRRCLIRRGFNVKFNISFNDVNTKDITRIIINSENFQTVPVIFEEIKLVSFSSTVKYDEEREDIIRFYIDVHVRYKHFDGGENGCSILQIKGRYNFDVDVIDWELLGE